MTNKLLEYDDLVEIRKFLLKSDFFNMLSVSFSQLYASNLNETNLQQIINNYATKLASLNQIDFSLRLDKIIDKNQYLKINGLNFNVQYNCLNYLYEKQYLFLVIFKTVTNSDNDINFFNAYEEIKMVFCQELIKFLVQNQTVLNQENWDNLCNQWILNLKKQNANLKPWHIVFYQKDEILMHVSLTYNNYVLLFEFRKLNNA